MKIRSAKAKGRRACQRFVNALIKHFPELGQDDFYIAPSSVNGVDIKFSQKAKTVLGFDFAPEVKNQERLPLWQAIEQATRLATPTQTPILVFTRNHSDMYVALKTEDFIKVIKK